MLAAEQSLHAVVQSVEGDVEVARVTSGRLQTQPGGAQRADGHQGQSSEPDQRYLLGQLVQGQVADGEDQDPM